MKVLALDIGGTAVKYGLFQDNKIKFGQFPVKDTDGNEDIPKSICSFSKEHMPDLITISAPGPFDFETGTSKMTHKLLSMYNVCLKDELKKAVPSARVMFVHDSTAFAVGVLSEYPELKEKDVSVIMLGTGFGYSFLKKGKALLNEKQTPLHPLWNRPFKDGISEDYVSTRVLISEAEKCGFKADNVLDISIAARNGDEKLLKVFYEYGKNLGMCVMNAYETDKFLEIVIGGQISLSWNLMKEGFESVCKIKYSIIENPDKCAIYGLIDCAVNGKEKFCIYEV